MKTRILLTVLMIGMIIGAFAQQTTMVLTFTADNNGQHEPLNNILIKNLTQGGDTTLYAPDSVLVLHITGMEEVSDFGGHGFSLSHNYPNPMKGETTIGLHISKSGNVLVKVSDVMGSEAVNQEFQLAQGSHSFTFYPGKESMYFLTIYTDMQSRTIKMLNSPSNSYLSGYCNLQYNGQQNISAREYKSGNVLNNFVFNPGDQLKFTASTGLGERVITSAPTKDQTYYFHYTGESCPGAPTVTDIDGNIYNTIQIGSQCWMKENLKTATYNNGTSIPFVPDENTWNNLSTGAYIWYDNDITWKDKYGALYNWFATVDPNALCPTGWHVPTHEEWTALTYYIGGESSPHGDELKSCRQESSPYGGNCNTGDHPRWNECETCYGKDGYGFSGFPGGYRSPSGYYDAIGSSGHWWSSTGHSSIRAWGRSLWYSYGNVFVDDGNRLTGLSVRCLKDH